MYEMDKPRLRSSHLVTNIFSGCGEKRELNNLKADLNTTNVEKTKIKNSIDIKLIIFRFFFFHPKFHFLMSVKVLLNLVRFFLL